VEPLRENMISLKHS